MTDLIVSSTELSHNIPKEDEAIHERIAQINLSKEKVSATLRHLTDRLGKMFRVLNSSTQDLQEEMVRVRQEILSVQQKMREQVLKEAEYNRSPPDDLDAEFEQFDGDRARFESQVEFQTDELPVSEDASLVKMFRVIASKTHPDKTDDPELHALFIQAKEFRRQGDLEGIKNIYNYVTGKVNRLLDALMKKLEASLENLRFLEMQLDAVRRSDDYRLLDLFERDPENVKSMARLQFSTRLRSLYAQLAHMKVVSGIATQDDGFCVNFERG